MELAIEMLLRLRGRYEAHHGVRITEGAIVAAARYGDRYISNRFLPDKAIDLIDEAGSRVKLTRTGSVRSTVQVREYQRDLVPLRKGVQSLLEQQAFEAASDLQAQQSALEAELNSALLESGRGGFSIPLVTAEDVAEIVASWTGIPVAAIAANEMERLLHLESDLHARVIGQEHAVSAVARAIRRSRAGTRNPNRPIASFIFSGPTGVGKTELVKALAATVFGDEEAIIRFDMSEFMERHAVSRLIGAPPGYLGSGEGGQLTEAVRRRPYAVVLLDEVEKAHPDVFNLLLQVLDEGQLTDSQGRTVDFRNTMIVMTTNVGSRVIQKRAAGGIGFEFSDGSDEEVNNLRIQRAVHEELGHHFRPEFLNRVDEILVFRQLTEDQIRQVADILVREVGGWLQDKGILLSVTDAFINHAVKLGFDPTYGARPLRRAITTLLEDSLAEAILRGEVSEGDSVRVDWDVLENRITISVPTRTPVLSRQLALA